MLLVDVVYRVMVVVSGGFGIRVVKQEEEVERCETSDERGLDDDDDRWNPEPRVKTTRERNGGRKGQ